MKNNKILPLWFKEPIYIFINELKCHFPLTIAFYHAICIFCEHKGIKEEKKKRIYQCLNDTINKYLVKKYIHVLESISVEAPVYYNNNWPIWIFWWQGEKNAPEIVRICISNIRKHANGHPVNVISQENYRDYISVSNTMLIKLQQKKISLTHFSDWYRMELLAKHGGFWIDGSLYISQEIPDDLIGEKIFTVRNPMNDYRNVSQWNWTVGAIGGPKNHLLFRCVRALLTEYWKDNDIVLDYYLFDHMVKIVFDYYDIVADEIKNIEPNNSNFYFLQNYANEPFDKEIYRVNMAESSTWIFKISWKGEYRLKTVQGKNTFYSEIIGNNL